MMKIIITDKPLDILLLILKNHSKFINIITKEVLILEELTFNLDWEVIDRVKLHTLISKIDLKLEETFIFINEVNIKLINKYPNYDYIIIDNDYSKYQLVNYQYFIFEKKHLQLLKKYFFNKNVIYQKITTKYAIYHQNNITNFYLDYQLDCYLDYLINNL